MIVKFKPFDTLFFRDGKPFNMAEETVAAGIFLPFPSVIYGAMRSSYIAQNGGIENFANMKDDIGTKDWPGKFMLRSVCLERNSVKYYPAPLDMGILSWDRDRGAVSELMKKDTDCAFSSNTDDIDSLLIPAADTTKIEEGRYFIAETYFKDYFNGIRKGYPLSNISSFILPEAKVGIKRDNRSHTSEEGALYRVNMNRLKEDVLIDVNIDGIDSNRFTQILKIGGEGRSVCISRDKEVGILAGSLNISDIMTNIKEKGRFRVYFMTPAIFTEGWRPMFEGIDNNQIKLASAATGKPIFSGGWDIVKKMPKPMLKVIPSGSVYYYDVPDKNGIESIINSIHLKNHGEKKEEGFGYAVVTAA